MVQLPEGLGWGASGAAATPGGGIGGGGGGGSNGGTNSAVSTRAPPPASLDCSFDELQTRAARAMLRLDGTQRTQSTTSTRKPLLATPVYPQRMTAEYDSFVRFVARVAESGGGSGGRGLHSSTFWLNISAFCGTKGEFRG